MPRHGSESIFVNEQEFYEEFFESRGLTKITQYRPPRLPPITVKVASRFARERYVWKAGDHYYTLASRFYGDPKLWWTIGWFNGKPTEATLKPGDVIYIPRPVSKLLTFLGMGSV
tara:strand:+ start:1996 stop:2340 length:345 start_codon:yes stop_codon:yes gene_type:complete